MTKLGWVGLACALVVAGCRQSSDGGPPSLLGAKGRTVVSTDGKLQVVIWPDSLSDDVKVAIATVAAPAAGTHGDSYKVNPVGTEISSYYPAQLTLSYDGV